MTTAFDDTGQHPVTSAIAAVSQLLGEVADLGLWTLRPAETETNLTALAALRNQITEVERATPATPTGSTSALRPGPRTPAATGPTPPGRPNATRSAASLSRTPWTMTTSP